MTAKPVYRSTASLKNFEYFVGHLSPPPSILSLIMGADCMSRKGDDFSGALFLQKTSLLNRANNFANFSSYSARRQTQILLG